MNPILIAFSTAVLGKGEILKLFVLSIEKAQA